MKIEFRPDFKVRPKLRIAWPRLSELFAVLRFKPEKNPGSRRRALCALAVILVLLGLCLLVLLGTKD